MRKIYDLLKKMCPNGVEYKSLCDITKMSAGDRITKSMMADDKKYPVMGAGLMPTGYYDNWNRENTISVSRAGVGAGSVGWHPEKFWATDVCFTVEQKNELANIKYVYYAMKAQEKNRVNHIYGGSMPKIDKDYLWNMKIPVPPIEIQNEIVCILDDLTLLSEELLSELSAELKARQKQYDFYKNKLFEFPNEVEKIEFGKLCDIVTKQTGFDYSKSIKSALVREYKTGFLPYLQTKFFEGKCFEYNTDYYIPREVAENFPKILLNQKAILLSIVGASIGNIGLFDGKKECFLGGAICVAKVLPEYNIEYIYYYLTSKNGQKQIFNKVKGAGQATVTIEDIRKFIIPMPSIEKQNEIVRKIGKFDEITNDILNGLPAEIEARQKQYEYYRNKLLTFKELKVEN